MYVVRWHFFTATTRTIVECPRLHRVISTLYTIYNEDLICRNLESAAVECVRFDKISAVA